MPDAVSQRLAARYHQNQVAAIRRLDRFAGTLRARYAGLLRSLVGMAAESDWATIELVRRFTIAWSANRNAVQAAIRETLRAEVLRSHHQTVQAIIRTVPLRWFAPLNARLAWLATEPVREDEDPELPVATDFALEPIAPWHTAARMTREEARRLIEETLFPTPTAAQIEAWLTSPVGGMTWEDRFRRYSQSDQQRLLGELTTGAATGENVAQLRTRLLPIVAGEEYRAQRIARTEGRRVAELAQQQIVAEMGDLVASQQIVAVLDQFTRPEHALRNGRLFHRQDDGSFVADNGQLLPQLPDAPNCRCMAIPALEPPEEFLTDPALRQEFQTATADTIPDPAAYSQWFAKAETPARLHAVGVRRYHEMERRLSREPEWIDFVDENGNLLSSSRIRFESETDRTDRRGRVASVMAEREHFYRRVYSQGMLLPQIQAQPAGAGKVVRKKKTPLQRFGDRLNKWKEGALSSKEIDRRAAFSDSLRAPAAVRDEVLRRDRYHAKRIASLESLHQEFLSSAQIENWTDEHQRFHVSVLNELAREKLLRQKELRSAVAVPPAMRGKLVRSQSEAFASAGNTASLNADAASMFLESIAHKDVVAGVRSIELRLMREHPACSPRDTREFYISADKAGYFRKASSTRTYVHEASHHLEYEIPGCQDALRAYLARVTNGAKLTPLGKGYRKNEVYFPRTDGRKWIHDYMGKRYPEATELASMAIEYLYSDPALLASRDPELFRIVVSYLRGKGKK